MVSGRCFVFSVVGGPFYFPMMVVGRCFNKYTVSGQWLTVYGRWSMVGGMVIPYSSKCEFTECVRGGYFVIPCLSHYYYSSPFHFKSETKIFLYFTKIYKIAMLICQCSVGFF